MQVLKAASSVRIFAFIKRAFFYAAVLVLVTTCSSVTYAQVWYTGAGIGRSGVNNIGSCSNSNGLFGPGFSCSGNDSSSGWSLFAGYEINRYLAVQGSYVDLGEFKGSASGNRFGGAPGNTVTTNGTHKPSGFSLDALGTWPGAERFGVIGRVGIFVWTLDSTVTTSTLNGSTTASDKATGTSFDFGVGVKYDFNKNLWIRAEFQWFPSIGNDTTGKSDAYLTSASLVYRFRSSFY